MWRTLLAMVKSVEFSVSHDLIASTRTSPWSEVPMCDIRAMLISPTYIGFARSSLTSAYPGDDPSTDKPANQIEYTNWIDNAIEKNKIDPVFSVVLERGDNGGSGQLALGGLPTIDFDQDFTTVPSEKFPLSNIPAAQTEYSYYTTTPDGIVINGESKSTNWPAIIDTGTTLAFVPNDIAVLINAAFDPPSKYIESVGYFESK